MIGLNSFVFHSQPTFSLTQYSRGLDYYYGDLKQNIDKIDAFLCTHLLYGQFERKNQ